MDRAAKHWPTIQSCLPHGKPFRVHEVGCLVGGILKVTGPTAYVYVGNALNWALRHGSPGLHRVDRSTWLYTPFHADSSITA
jgi:hypothetical protein